MQRHDTAPRPAGRPAAPARRPGRLAAVGLLSAALGAGLLAPPAVADHDDTVIELTFPVADPHDAVSFIDDFHHGRSGGREHGATDVMAPKHRPIHAAVGGTVGFTPYPEPGYGWMLSILGDDGRLYRYLHINNDNPGTDDGKGGPEHAFAPRIAKAMLDKGDTLNASDGIRVERGEHVAYVGDSGNAEGTAPHLHFEIFTDHSQGSQRINPYASLVAALDRDDVPGTKAATEEHHGPFVDLDPDGPHTESVLRLAADGVVTGCAPDRYCPRDDLQRGDLAASLAAALGLKAQGTADFDDVSSKDPNAPAIAAVDEAGILKGYGDGRFGPTDALSRAQLATVLVRAFELQVSGTHGSELFTDVGEGNVHGEHIAAIHAAGVTTGCDVERYCGSRAVTRSQIASFIDRGLAGF